MRQFIAFISRPHRMATVSVLVLVLVLVWAAGMFCAATCSGQDAVEELPPARASKSPTSRPGPVTEIVRERHPDGVVAVERHVMLDESQNFVNHGPYTQFDEGGAKLQSGQYKMGERHGMWTRWLRGFEATLLQEAPYNSFRAPFISQANFRDGKLNGAWVIYDSAQRKVSEINFVEGERNGPSVWWYPSGGKMRELAFVDNQLQGSATFYRTNGQVVRKEDYERGHRIERLSQKYPEGQKYCEGTYRHPKIVITVPDDWDATSVAQFEMQGEGTKEGEWVVYYPNGQKQMVGSYNRDQPMGNFTWWHETGQRASTGKFSEGQKAGQWTWWHPNGYKMSQGRFLDDNPYGSWASWDSTGSLLQRIDAVNESEAIVSDGTEELPDPESSFPEGEAMVSNGPEELPEPKSTHATEEVLPTPDTRLIKDSIENYFLPARLQADPTK